MFEGAAVQIVAQLYDPHTQRCRYHQLIKEFFTYKSKEYKDSELKETFISQFLDYYRKFGSIETHESLRKAFHLLDKERSNIDYLAFQSKPCHQSKQCSS